MFIIAMLLGLLFFALAMVGDAVLRCVAIKTVPYIGLLVALTLACGCARLRLPVEPFFIIFAVVGWLSLYRWYTKDSEGNVQ
jgi:hypothetical protein